MPKIWLPNVDDALINNAENHAIYGMPKYLWLLSEDDICITPFEIKTDFLNYIAAIKGFKNPFQTIAVKTLSQPYALIDSIFQNPELVEYLKELGKSGRWELEPYIQSRKVIELSNKTNIPVKYSDEKAVMDGLIDRLNCKYEFKQFCKKIGLKTPRSWKPNSIQEVRDIFKNSNYRFILKKTKSIGGAGNLTGSNAKLLKTAENWINQKESFLIEEYLELYKTLGALVYIKNDDIIFAGIDEQIITDCIWKGLLYPFENYEINKFIQAKSLELAEQFHMLGGRGLLNIDFGIVQSKKTRHQIFGFEANFRQNALGLLVNVFYRKGKFLLHYTDFEAKLSCFNDAVDKLSKISIEGRPVLANSLDEHQGIIVSDVKLGLNKYGALIFSTDKNYIINAANMLGITL